MQILSQNKLNSGFIFQFQGQSIKSLECREHVGVGVPLERLHHGPDLARRLLLPAAAAAAALVLPHVGDEEVSVLVDHGELARVGQADLVEGDLRYLLSEIK